VNNIIYDIIVQILVILFYKSPARTLRIRLVASISLTVRALQFAYNDSSFHYQAWHLSLFTGQVYQLPDQLPNFAPIFPTFGANVRAWKSTEAAAVKCEKFHFVWITSFILANRHRETHTHIHKRKQPHPHRGRNTCTG